MSERDIIIGAPAATVHITGSKPFTCADCGDEVWLAPSGQELRQERDLEVLCIRCGLASASEAGETFEALTPRQIEEIVTEVTRPSRFTPWQ